MATRALLTPTDITRAGVAVPAETAGVAADGHKFANDGNVFLLVRNASTTTARVLTVQTPGTVDGLAIADLTVSIPATLSRYIGRFPSGIYNQADGMVYVDYPAGNEADLKVQVLRLV